MNLEEQKQTEQPYDGRYIDTNLAVLEGEAARQRRSEDAPRFAENQVARLVPSRWHEDGLEPTYYGKPALKRSVWSWSVPAYYYVGGLSGAAMTLGLAVQLLGGPQLRRLEERCRWVGAVGGGIGSALLIYDLGRRMRFLFMLRVFRPTSPMSMGSWILASATPLSAGSALLTMSPGLLRRIGDYMGLEAGVLGMALATYTGVLLGNTAVPLWQQTRRSLPLLFGASSIASAAAVFQFFPLDRREEALVFHFGAVGRAAELAAARLVMHEAKSVPGVDKPLRQGASGALWRAATLLTVASLAVSLLPARSRKKQIASAVLGSLGSLALRFAIDTAGNASAADPRVTFRQQRSGYGGAEVTGRPAVTGSSEIRPLPQPRTLDELAGAQRYPRTDL